MPAVIVSLPPKPGASEVAVVSTLVKVGAKYGVKARSALSPKITLLPSPAVIVSLPMPPTITSLPEPAVITSLPPSAGPSAPVSVLVMCTRTAGSKVATPSSPKTTLLPPPALIVSLPWPPRMTSLPEPVVILSSPPPAVGSVVRAVTSPPVFVSKANEPLSPITRLSPSPALIVSLPLPPMIRSAPAPPVIVSVPPTVGSIDSASWTVIGRPPNCAAFTVAAKTAPLSPMTMLLAVPPVMVSLPAPPTTIALPAPTLIVSFPP